MIQNVSNPGQRLLVPKTGTGDAARELRVLIASDNASLKFGGEAALALHHFRTLLDKGVDVRLVVHERARPELAERFPDDQDRIEYLPDSPIHRWLWRAGRTIPTRQRFFTTDMIMRWLTQRSMQRVVRRLVKQHGIDVVHVPSPVSPKEPSLLHDLGVPVVIGPMNGGMTYPSAFARMEGFWSRWLFRIGRACSRPVHALMPGKVKADLLLVANERTARALPRHCRGQIVELVENGVDLRLWEPIDRASHQQSPVRFVWMGRMVDWKAVDLLLRAFYRLTATGCDAVLELIGDGPERSRLEVLADELGLERGRQVVFQGWLRQEHAAARLRHADVFVLPSLYECGGAVVLEAMAMGLPTVATAWGGPMDYIVPEQTGLMVPVDSEEAVVGGLSDAMGRLAESPELRARMGDEARRRVEQHFDWDRKADRMLGLFMTVVKAEQPA